MRAKILTIAFIVFIYVSGYPSARLAKWIVHRAGYYTASDGSLKIAGHMVSQGDFGIAIFNLPGSSLPWVVCTTYWPLRQLEKLYWQVRHPSGSAWPPEWELTESTAGY